MGYELLLPFAKWGAILAGGILLLLFIKRTLEKLGALKAKLEQSEEVGDALERFQHEKQKASDEVDQLPRSAIAAKLRKLAARRRRS